MSAAYFALRRKRSPMSLADSNRHLRRATLGVNQTEAAAAVGQRVDQWFDAQFAIPYVPNQARTIADTQQFPDWPAGPYLTGGWPNGNQFLNWKFQRPEKLRTRCVYAIAEYFSVGAMADGVGSFQPYANHWEIIESEVHNGTFRSMLERITRSQLMAYWLTYYKNSRTDGVRQPDENYAREIMQLYTIGLWELNLDGSRRLNGQLPPEDPRYVPGGTAEVPTYMQADIENLARVFTGMTARHWNGTSLVSVGDSYLYNAPIGGTNNQDLAGNTGWYAQMYYSPDHHESTLPKNALYGRIAIPAGTSGDDSLSTTLDALVNHPSMAPFFCKEMIRLMITSNPSPEYVARVASVFRNDGNGVVGNLRAVFKAIVTDQEAVAPLSKNLTSRIPSIEEQRLSFTLVWQRPLTVEGAPFAEPSGDYPGSTTYGLALFGMGWESPYHTFQNRSVFGRWPKAYAAAGPIFNSGRFSPELASLTEVQSSELLNSGDIVRAMSNSAPVWFRDNVMTTGDRTAVLEELNRIFTGNTAPPDFVAELMNWMTTQRHSFFDTPVLAANTLRNLMFAFWLSPWGIARK
jgi:uncharacterized protein (DUF1800 family)